MLFVIKCLPQTLNKLVVLLKANGSNTNRNTRRKANQRPKGADCTTRSNKARFAAGDPDCELCEGHKERKVHGCRQEESNRIALFGNKELFKHRRTCPQTRSKERRVMRSFPLFSFSKIALTIMYIDLLDSHYGYASLMLKELWSK